MEEIKISQQAGTVTANFDEVKKYLNEQLEVYRVMVFTEDSKKIAKATVAELRKEKKALADRVKEVKSEYMKPMDEFMAKANELSALFDEPINFINGQVEAFETKRIEEKKELIKELYEDTVPEELREIISLSSIYNSKWENATTNKKAIIDEILDWKGKACEALEAIKSLNSDMEATALSMYAQNHDLTACIVYLNNYEKQKKEILERQQEQMRREEEERIRAEERAKIEAEQKQAQEIEQAKAEAIDALIPTDTDAEVETCTYFIKLTPEAKEKLEMYMDSVGIEYEQLPM